MHIVDFIYNVIDKFAPMDGTEKVSLREDAMSWYLKMRDKVFKSGQNKVIQDDFDPKTAPLKLKVIYWCENWAVRTGIAVAFILIVPYIQGIWDGRDDDDEDRR